MPPTPIHGTRAEVEQAAWHRCANQEGGPVHELKRELESMRSKVDELKWFLAKLIGALTLAALILPTAVALWTYYNPRQVAKTPSIITQAHAETKGSP